MSITIQFDPKAYFHCAECNELQPRSYDKNEKMRFCLECSKIVCKKCTPKHTEKYVMISAEQVNERLEDTFKSFMPHLFPENLEK